MMALPPPNAPKPAGSPMSTPSVPGPDTSGPNANASKTLESDLRKVDEDLVDIINSFTQGKKGSQLVPLLKKMEEDLRDLLASLKKQSPKQLIAELNKLEGDLKKMEGKQKELALKLDEKDKNALTTLQGEVSQIKQQMQQLTADEIKVAGALDAMSSRQEVSKTIALIQKMCAGIQVGTVGGVQFTSVDLKKTAEVPSYFANANLTITPGADGKMTIQFTNLTREQQAAAIAAIQQHPELLLELLDRVPINKLQINEQTITLPTAEPGREQEGRREGGREGGGEQRERREPGR